MLSVSYFLPGLPVTPFWEHSPHHLTNAESSLAQLFPINSLCCFLSSYCAKAAVTTNHREGGLNNRNFLSHNPGGWRVDFWRGLSPLFEDCHLLMYPQLASSLCHMERGLWCLFFFYKENQPYKIRALTLWPQLTLITPLKALSPNSVMGG